MLAILGMPQPVISGTSHHLGVDTFCVHHSLLLRMVIKQSQALSRVTEFVMFCIAKDALLPPR